MRHGHRGAIAIAETLDALYAFAATTDAVPSRHFDSYFDATLGDETVRAFLQRENPAAARSMADKFEARPRLWLLVDSAQFDTRDPFRPRGAKPVRSRSSVSRCLGPWRGRRAPAMAAEA